jgi:hypothetical protein
MDELKKKLDIINEDVTEIKIATARLEINYDNNNKILDRLTASVEHHIKRTDALEELVLELKSQQERADLSIENKVSLLDRDLNNHIDKVKLTVYILTLLGAGLIGLKELGVLDKLF